MATTKKRRRVLETFRINMDTSTGIMYLILLLIIQASSIVASDPVEVCPGETFRARCGPDEVIVMDDAQYGRMRVGKCINTKQDFMGCSNQVLTLVDRWCSGRRSCQMIIPNEELRVANTECANYLYMYFEPSYHCIKVFAEEPSKCVSRVTLPAKQGFISSQVTDETGCVSLKAPGVIHANSGQRIKFTLLDFATTVRKRSAGPVYGYIIDRTVQINKTIYGGGQREREIYTSESAMVEIALSTKSERHQDGDFLLEYKVVGCSDLDTPPDAWYKRKGDNATIGCNNSPKLWHLRCDGEKWHGVVGNCSAVLIGASTEDDEKTGFLSTNMFYIITGGAAAIVLLVIVVTVACICHNKKSIKDESRKAVLTPGSPSQSGTSRKPAGAGKYKSIENGGNDDLVYNVNARNVIRFTKDGISRECPPRPEPGSALAQVMMLTQPDPAYGPINNVDLLDLCVDPPESSSLMPLDPAVTSLGLPPPPPEASAQSGSKTLPPAQYEIVQVKNRPKSIHKDGNGSFNNSRLNKEPPTPQTPPLPTRKEPLCLVSSSDSSADNSPVHTPRTPHTPDPNCIYENQSITLSKGSGSNRGSPHIPRRPPRKCDDGRKTGESTRTPSPTQLPNVEAAALEALLFQEAADKLRSESMKRAKSVPEETGPVSDVPDDLPPPPPLPETENYYNIDELTGVPREDPTIPILPDEVPPPAPLTPPPTPPAEIQPTESYYSNDPMCQPPSEPAPPPPGDCGECYYNNCDCPGEHCRKDVHV